MVKEKIEIFYFYFLSLKFWLHSVMHTEESNFSNFVIEYLSEIETEFENTYPVYQGPIWVQIMKKWMLKISWHTPFKV